METTWTRGCARWRPEVRYALGFAAGILSGLAFTASSIMQKRAMNSIRAGSPLFRNLLKKPLWLAGLAAAFAIGAPLNMAAYVAIGPTLPPALGSIGLAATPALARLFLGERPPARIIAGACAIALAVACIGLSGLAIAPESVDWAGRPMLARAMIAAACMAAAVAALAGLGARSRAHGAPCFALAAGSAQALANALMAPIAGQLGRLASGRLDASGLAIMAAASLALIAVNAGAIAMAQLALRKGVASTAVPLQQLPIQAIPLVLHIALYRGDFGAAGETALLALGVAVLIAGSFALGLDGKPISGRHRALPAGLALAVALGLAFAHPSRLDAQEATQATARTYRYSCIDASGRVSGSMEILVTALGDGMEIESSDSAGISQYARLGPGMIQEEVRIETAAGAMVRYALSSTGDSWARSGRPGGSVGRTENSRLDTLSLFFVLPALVDHEKPGSEASFTLIRTSGGQKASMRLRAEGIVAAPGLDGKTESAYRISMVLADPIGRLFWPYEYNYCFRAGDLIMVAYDGPDESRNFSRMVLVEAEERD